MSSMGEGFAYARWFRLRWPKDCRHYAVTDSIYWYHGLPLTCNAYWLWRNNKR